MAKDPLAVSGQFPLLLTLGIRWLRETLILIALMTAGILGYGAYCFGNGSDND